MGNMSNPSINRWGLNLFWYKYWYSDKMYQLNIQQDHAFGWMVYTYLFFGTLFFKYVFINKYWFKKKFNFNFNGYLEHNAKYFKYKEFKDLVTQELSIQKLRIKTSHIYYSRVWIFRYQQWLIINFYNYKPLIKNKKHTIRSKKTLLFAQIANNVKFKNNCKRLKLFLLLITCKFQQTNNLYLF
uniref:Ribosomal protein S3a n=1 Tax=Pseudourostyla cristata TaxID=293816 RepID=A0A4P9JLE1_9SPIT|nr:ribosomal protein S3a [Pseudourostyla cristata]